ncbi:MAG: PEGA domain-containing protein [Phycisphaerales bacterium]
MLLCCFAAFPAGCLERTVTVTSDPPGALVYLNDTEVGRTPVETAFTFYGDYDVRLRREGHEPLITHERTRPPPWEWIPIDLVSTALPARIVTRKHWHYRLAPSPTLDETTERALLGRAGELRARVEE